MTSAHVFTYYQERKRGALAVIVFWAACIVTLWWSLATNHPNSGPMILAIVAAYGTLVSVSSRSLIVDSESIRLPCRMGKSLFALPGPSPTLSWRSIAAITRYGMYIEIGLHSGKSYVISSDHNPERGLDVFEVLRACAPPEVVVDDKTSELRPGITRWSRLPRPR